MDSSLAIIKSGVKATQEEPQNQLSEVEKFLKDLEEIRLYIPPTNNFGHQASCVNVLFVLMKLVDDKHKPFRIIFQEEQNGTAVWSKLQVLIPGLPDKFPLESNENGYQLESPLGEIYFHSLTGAPTYVKNKNIEILKLGFSGALDSPEYIFDNSAPDLISWLKLDNFLLIQPFRWREEEAVNAVYNYDFVNKQTTKIACFDDNRDLPEFEDLCNYISVESPYDADWELLQKKHEQKYLWTQAVIKIAENETAHISPIYFTQNRTATQPPYSLIFNLIMGILKALSDKNKKTIVVMLGSFEPEHYAALDRLLKEGKYEKEGEEKDVSLSLKQLIVDLKANERVAIMPVDDAGGVEERLGRLPKDGVLVVPLGSLDKQIKGLPRSIFNYIFSKATLPCAFEGKGTASLVLNLGKPFFQLTSFDVVRETAEIPSLYPTLSKTQTSAARECRSVSRLLDIEPGQYAPAHCDRIASFITETCNIEATSNVTLKSYFDALRTYYHMLENDKLVAALSYLLSSRQA